MRSSKCGPNACVRKSGSVWTVPARAILGVPAVFKETSINWPILVPTSTSEMALALLVDVGACWRPQVQEWTVTPGIALSLKEIGAADKR
mmetsp:Transcript_106322/g.183339  ORF Transcript_106322/g.183339 Transcript_106322/m.183339 type:complete len:90 (+) Transcript_106322:121-390(+)